MSSSVIGALQMIVRYGMIMMTSDALTTVNEYEEREYPRLTDHWKLLLKNSNQYDHKTPTWQTDGQTTYYSNTALSEFFERFLHH